ncbi:unnamed protein product [Adineta steineri]|uniref:F-box domain-containing protein n=1 Tax=Adineta steineri TaxID=433720 RepID=A0A819F1Y2_9BILA|nr:unnamed protein product [Adineta steineri]CAF3860365.1 unnamed protein product [Adineta steineri]
MTEPKRFKRESTTFEYLPNEICVEIFSYINGVDTVYAFSLLNLRFQSLINNYVDIFNFKSISKKKFDFVIQRHHNIQQWQSLCLSNNDDTPGQIKLFCQLFPSTEDIDQFQSLTKLQSLTILNAQDKDTEKFLLQIPLFNNLVSLSIENVCGVSIQSINLPTLQRLTLTSCKHTSWIMNCSSLKSFEYTITQNCPHDHELVFPKTLTRLKIYYNEYSDGKDIRLLLRQMPNLKILALFNKSIYSPMPDGKYWEELIKSSLPLLKTFQFYFPYSRHSNSLDDLNTMIKSFSTPFYLLEKRWFVRCDRSAEYSYKEFLYSLPFAFSQLPIDTPVYKTSISTLPAIDINEINSNYYTKINTLILNEPHEEPPIFLLPSNIIYLTLNATLSKSWLYLLKELHYLDIQHGADMSSDDFAQLLEYTPNLQSLTISIKRLKKLTDKFQHQIVCQYLSERIKSLTITRSDYNHSRSSLGHVSIHALSSLTRILSSKCEHLSLAIMANPNTVRPILRRMTQLRSLRIQWPRNFTVSDWVQKKSTYSTALDFVHMNDKQEFFIWFGNRF